MLSHEDQVRRLALSAPAAAPAAVVAGDPCFDRIVASLPLRNRYRARLGVGDRLLVYVSSTWSPESAIGVRFDLIRELLAELPRDSYAVAVAVHPNISHLHGPGQVRRWFADCVRAGLIILPEIDDWRTGLIAADLVVGDNGSVTGYAAAIGRPTILCAFPEVPDGTPISALGELAPRLPAHGPLAPYLEAVLAEHEPSRYAEVADGVTSVPGRAHERLRELFYGILDLTPPPTESAPILLPPPAEVRPAPYFADTVATRVADDGTIHLVRRPAELQRIAFPGIRPGIDVHLCCTADYPMLALRERADILVGTSADAHGDVPDWLRNTLRDNSFCEVAAIVEGDSCRALTRSGVEVTMTTGGPADLLPSVVYAWFYGGRSPAVSPVAVEAGGIRYAVEITFD
ncbi:hypothetical protein [Nocardia wallacei]|uniref:hypothetical protein n=1 Tax=Nocardia wallacei TaxID=480035 RepID=UPI002458A4E6|nr:hypothetical protein [Nocardia wallacei]